MGKNSIFSKKTQAESGHKSKILVGVMILSILFLMNFASAELFQFDNVKSYDAEKKEVTITNTFGLGSDILKATLETPQINYVSAGYSKISQITITSTKDYSNFMDNLKLYDMNDKNKEFNRDFDLKYLELKEKGKDENGTMKYEEIWNDFNGNLKLGEKITFGIFMNVTYGEHFDYIPSFAGVEINEWAEVIVIDASGFPYASSGTVGGSADYRGIIIIPKKNISIINITKSSGANPVEVHIWKIGSRIAEANFSGDVATFSEPYPVLINGTKYGIFTNSMYPPTTYTSKYTTGASFPVVGTNLNYFGGANGQSNENETYYFDVSRDAPHNILAIGSREYTGIFDPSVTVNSPANISNFSVSTIAFNFTAYDNNVGGGIDSVILYIDSVAVETNTTNMSNGTNYIINRAVSSGYHNWSVSVLSRNSTNVTSALRVFNITIYSPTITLNSPIAYYNTTNQSIQFNSTISDDFNIQNVSLYINGVLNETNTSNVQGTYLFNKIINDGSHYWSIIAYDNDSNPTQSANRYFTIDTTPYIAFITPPTLVNYANITQEYIPMKVNVSTPYFKNISFYLENENGTSYTQYFTNETYDINFTNIPDAHYHYNVTVCTTTNRCNITEMRHINHDTTSPVLSVTGSASAYSSVLPINVTWSLFSSDLLSDKCWYYTSDNSTNFSVTCNSSTKTNFTSHGSKTIYYFGNDTSGNQASGSTTLFIGYYPYTQSTDKTNVGSGDSVVFTLYVNGTDVSNQFSSTTATLYFNGTNYTYDTVDRTNQNYTKFTKTLYMTIGNTTGAITTYNWSYSVKNTTAIPLNVTTTNSSVKVYLMSVYECSAGSRYILNMSLKDEELNSLVNASLNSTVIEVDVMVSSRANTSATWNFSKKWINNDTVYICVPPNVLTYSSYKIDFTAGYKIDNYVQEFYYMDNGTIDSTNSFNSYTTNPISLYDLKSADSTTFLFSFKDEDNLEVPNAIIHVYRKYIGDGVFREVERAKQDDNGETHVHLVEEDVIYYFMVTEDGNILYTSTNYNAKCLDTPCQIKLSASTDYVEFPTDYDKINGTLYTLTTDKTTRTVTLNYGSNASQIVNLSLFKVVDGVVQYINTTSTSGTSGSLTLVVPLTTGNETFFASIFTNGEFIRSEWIDLKEKAQDYFGTTGAILGGLLVLTLIFMAISEGVMLIVVGIVAIFVIVAMQLVDMSWMAIISIVIAGGLIIWKMTQGGNRR